MNKNLKLTYDGDNNSLQTDIKLNKKNYIIMIVPIVLVILLILSIAIYVNIVNSPSNKLKKYLEEIEYVCNDNTCSKEIDNIFYTINYKKISMDIETVDYRITVSSSTPSLEVKNTGTICTYTKSNYEIFTLVDNSYIYENKCEKYITNINKFIEEYKSIVKQSGIDVNKLNK